MDVVVAAHSREVRTALFIALNAIPSITIAATATSSAELTSFCRAFQPEIAIVEGGLPGSPLSEFLSAFESLDAPARILVIGGEETESLAADFGKAEALRDVDHLLQIIPELTTNGATQ